MRQNKIKRWAFAAAVLLLMPFGADAAGLGRLNVQSYLGQPLNGEIELVSVAKNETITARLGSPEAYTQAGLAYEGVLGSVFAARAFVGLRDFTVAM